uniref:Uncharacterized protein n=1 Tax=Coccidioides posadasii RMSCC 3488 TaxID=454284 RepID=A0A0J6I5J7_COCPO|nr:hypothetical protein CPAG_02989 [Coccidioides posadasii RMSCC 3488]
MCIKLQGAFWRRRLTKWAGIAKSVKETVAIEFELQQHVDDSLIGAITTCTDLPALLGCKCMTATSLNETVTARCCSEAKGAYDDDAKAVRNPSRIFRQQTQAGMHFPIFLALMML